MKDLIQIEITADRSPCVSIREQVFILEQNVPKNLELDEFDDSATHILAKFSGEPAGCARLREVHDFLKVERVAVLSKFRGNSIAKKIMHFIEDIAASKKKTIILNAQESVIEFYKKLGYEAEGEKFVEAGIVHIKMKKTPNFGGLS